MPEGATAAGALRFNKNGDEIKVLPSEGNKLGDEAPSVEDERANDRLGIACNAGKAMEGASGEDGEGPSDGLAANCDANVCANKVDRGDVATETGLIAATGEETDIGC